MPRPAEVVVGIDVGTTSMKAVAFDLAGHEHGLAKAATEWDVASDGSVQIDADRLATCAIEVIADAGRRAGGRVVGIGITGMAETGIVVGPSGKPRTPAIAWYDQRGKEELAQLGPGFADEFSAVTGLAAKAECSFSKLIWHRAQGTTFSAGEQWANALEYVAYVLTGTLATEPSLASRTGLLDQASVAPWSTTLDLVGVDAAFVPQMVAAGTSVGPARASVPEGLRGAAVTVCGHDHLVASVGAGAAGAEALFDSCGTADVILRSVARTLSNEERAHLVANGLSAGRHCLPHTTAVLGATRSGLVLGRVLSMMGVHTIDDRRRVAASWTPGTARNAAVSIEEPSGWTNEVVIRVRDYISPDDVWAAAMEYVLEGTAQVLEPIAHVAGPYRTAHAAGGWAQLDGVLAGKASIMPGLLRSDVTLPGTRGAAMFAALAADRGDSVLAQQIPTNDSPQQKECVS